MAEPELQQVDAIRFAVNQAYQRHSRELSRIAMTTTRNRSLAQDVLQETFLRYFLTLMHGDVVAKERDWLCRVMRGLIADWRSSTAPDTELSLEDCCDTPAGQSDDEAAEGRVLPWASKAARRLAPREQQCIQLRAQGLEYREIATAMQIDIGTVGTLLNRAVQKLKQVLVRKEKMA